MSVKNEKGGISVETENIFPIIKRWLYSDKEIFLREIVSNASDAVTKLRRLISLGHYEPVDEDLIITVTLDKENGTITVSDNGIGMSDEELKKYIGQIALSGALDFIEKYEGEGSEAGTGIIGHFGLGFYSSFMVSDSVEIRTKSYAGSPAVHWVCTDSGEYEISAGDREERGTDVIMHISEDGKEFLDAGKLREILDKYCAFMPVDIYFKDVAEPEKERECTCGHKDGDEEECTCDLDPKPINDTHPLWLKNPSDCTDEEYKEFYGKVFKDFREPLFQIHINADYPLNFKGILYFPRISSEFDSLEGQVKLFYNQVFVADNIKEIIPEYLLMLKGVFDCPELPLNVSRSYLQNSGYVTKISQHITKKVADKLNGMFNTDREAFEKLWDDLKIFVEYGCIRDRKFYDRVKDSVLLPLTGDSGYKTVDEYLEAAKEKHENTVYYTADESAHAAYIAMYRARDIEVVRFDKFIDTQFINMLESDRNIKFFRVDAGIADALKADGEAYENEKLADLMKTVSGSDKLTVKFESLADDATPALLTLDEQSRRFDDMMKMYRMHKGEEAASLPVASTLTLNSASPLIRKLGETLDEKVARQIWTLALISQRQLTSDELVRFLSDSYELLGKL